MLIKLVSKRYVYTVQHILIIVILMCAYPCLAESTTQNLTSQHAGIDIKKCQWYK